MTGLILQCGGPTAVVNVSLVSAVRRWASVPGAGALYGGRYGLAALVTGDWIQLADRADEWLSAIEDTPGMALGGGRDRLTDGEIAAAPSLLQRRAVDTLLLIGGNGTMTAGRELAAAAAARRHRLRVVAIPKTIDNDVPATDVCPGFPSAARFLVDAVRDVAADVTSMRGYEDVVLIETMGRHAGWLAASTLLARSQPGDAPHVVLVPEQPVSDAAFLDAVREQHARSGICIVTVAEGVRDERGTLLAERVADRAVERDAAGQVILGRSGGPLPYLASLVRERLRLRCRLVRPDVLQRCSRAHVTALDRTLAAMAGAAAVDCAADDAGEPTMIGLHRAADAWRTARVPLEQVRGERTLPPDSLLDPTALLRLVL